MNTNTTTGSNQKLTKNTRKVASLFASLVTVAALLIGTLHAAALEAAVAATATTTIVTSLDDDGANTLREALAGTADTIEFDPSLNGKTITLTTALNITRSVTISGNVPITISGNNATRILTIGSTAAVTLSGVTIANATVNGNVNGGAIVNSGKLTLDNGSVVENNVARNGAGIYSTGQLSIFGESVIRNNTSTNRGAGVYINNGTAVIENARIYGNTGGAGNAIDRRKGSVTVTNSCIVNNQDLAVRGSNITTNNNWWGHTDGPFGHGGVGDSAESIVNVGTPQPTPIAGCPDRDDLYGLTIEKAVSAETTTTADTLTYTLNINSARADTVNASVNDHIPAGLSLIDSTIAIDPPAAGTIGTVPQIVSGLNISSGIPVTITYQVSVTANSSQTISNTASLSNSLGDVVSATAAVTVFACAPFPLSVATFEAFNDAIECYNASTTSGTYTINFSDDITRSSEGIAIDNTTIGVALHINGNSNALDGNMQYRGLEVRPDNVITVEDLTIQNGRAIFGAGIFSEGSLTLLNSTLQNNESEVHGGAIAIKDGTLDIQGSTISNNKAIGVGGGIYVYENAEQVTVSNQTVIQENMASQGSGIHIANQAVVEVQSSNLLSNHAENGGAVYAHFTASVVITNSCLVGNDETAWNSQSEFTSFNLTDNWWGHESGPSGIGPGLGDAIEGEQFAIQYSPFKTSAPVGCPTKEIPRLFLSKSASVASAETGQPITYTITIVNPGTVDATGLTVEDVLPAGALFESNSLIVTPTGAGTASNSLPVIMSNLTVPAASQVIITYRVAHYAVGNRGLSNEVSLIGSIISEPASAEINYIDTCDVTTLENPVASPTALNAKISCFNRVTVASDYVIRLTGDITLTSGIILSVDNNTSGVGLTLAGDQFTVDGSNTVPGFSIARDTKVTIDSLTIKNMRSSAIHTQGDLNIIASRLENNSSSQGGAINLNRGHLTISMSDVTSNTATSSGGAIYAHSNTVLTVLDSAFGNNGSNGDAGGIYNISDSAIISNSTFSNNTSGNRGGGVYNTTGTLSVINSTFSGNSAESGGGIYTRYGSTTLTHTTIVSNTATTIGSGIASKATAITGEHPPFRAPSGLSKTETNIRASIITGNFGRPDIELDIEIAGDTANTINSLDFNVVGVIGSGVLVAGTNDMLNSNSVQVAALADNGGSTQTHALTATSVAIDIVTGGDCPGTDQRGFSRVDNCDAGAYELSGVPTAVGLRGVGVNSAEITPYLILTMLVLLSGVVFGRKNKTTTKNP